MACSVPVRRWAWFVIVAALVGIILPGGFARADPGDDGMTVYCLGHQADLVRAAVALGVGTAGATSEVIHVGGADLSVDQWRAMRASDFRRSCAALRAANGAGGGSSASGPLVTAGTALFSAAVGAGFTWLVTSGRERSARRRQEALELRVSARAFVSAVLLYLLGWTSRSPEPPHADTVVERQVDVEARLRRIALARRWPEATALVKALGEAPLGTRLLDHERWSALDPDRRPEEAEAITRRLAKFIGDAEHVAYRLEHLRRGARAEAENR